MPILSESYDITTCLVNLSGLRDNVDQHFIALYWPAKTSLEIFFATKSWTYSGWLAKNYLSLLHLSLSLFSFLVDMYETFKKKWWIDVELICYDSVKYLVLLSVICYFVYGPALWETNPSIAPPCWSFPNISAKKIYMLWNFLTFSKILLTTNIPNFMIIDQVDQVLWLYCARTS